MTVQSAPVTCFSQVFRCDRRSLSQLRITTTVEISDPAPAAQNAAPELVVNRWGRLAKELNEESQKAAREYLVARARRIWGQLGNKIKRSKWCQLWRAAYAVPVFALRWVKGWRVTGR